MDQNKNQISQPSGQKLTKRQLRSRRREEKLLERQQEQKQGKHKRLITWLIAAIVLAGAGYGVVKMGSQSAGSIDGGALPATDQVAERDWVKGRAEAAVTLVEYSDFQCPACAQYYPMVKQLSEEFPDSLRVVYRHFPLVTIHPSADLAARSAEAAGAQGKFWEMHDKLFDNQSDWSENNARDKFSAYAQELGLDMEQFGDAQDSSEVKDKVRDDLSSGQRAGVSGTPTFFLNGRKISNPRSYNEFKELIRAESGMSEVKYPESVSTTTSESLQN